MLRSTQTWVVVLFLTIAGLSVFAYKVMVLGFPFAPGATTDFWDFEAQIQFAGTGDAAEVTVVRAHDTDHFVVLDETYLTPSGFGVRRTRAGTDRFARFERRRLENRATVFYRAVLVELDSAVAREEDTPEADDTYGDDARRAAAREEQTPFLFALDEIIDDARERSADDEGFIDQVIETLASTDDERVRALRAGGPSEMNDPARRLEVVLNAAGIPAQRVEGLRLTDRARDVPITRWVRLWRNGRWRTLDPQTGESLNPRRLLPLSTTDLPLVRYSGVSDVYVSFAVERRPQDSVTEALRRGESQAPIVAALSLLNLPLHTQDVFAVLLLVPVGALLIAFFRQVIGLPTYGTFMPVLIALSFRETSLLTGLVLFTLIVMIGLALRAYFNRLQLLLVPRLASVLTFVTLLMAIIAIGSNSFGISLGLSISLFPLVILTMTIERMSLTWDELGAREALKKGVGSLAAAVLSYLVIITDRVEHLVFTFPELLLVVLALTIALGRYNGFKLTEYLRFRALSGR